MRRIWLGLAVASLCATSAFAGDVTGEWARVDGKAKVRISPCGGMLCGSLTWVKDTNGPAKVGQKVFYDMQPSGDNSWAGKAFNPEDGKEYTGKMTLAGNSLNTAGCVFGGLICKSVDWKRAQ